MAKKNTFYQPLIWPDLPETDIYRFIHIPKTGGTTVRRWLINAGINFYLGKSKNLIVEDLQIVGMHKLSKWFTSENTIKFSIVRNPFTRIVSAFNYLKSCTTINDNRKLPSELTFEEFIFDLLKNDIYDETYLPQQQWLIGLKPNKILVHHIFKQENLETELQKFFNNYTPMPILNTGNIESYTDYYANDELVKLVIKKYEWDFFHLNYTTNIGKLNCSIFHAGNS